MELKSNAVILGMKMFNDKVEGKHYDYTKIYVEENFSKENAAARGSAVIEYRAGTSELFEKLKHLPFPITAELTIEISATGKVGPEGTKTTIVGVRPLSHGRDNKPLPMGKAA